MFGDGGQVGAGEVAQVADAALAMVERFDDEEAGGVGERLDGEDAGLRGGGRAAGDGGGHAGRGRSGRGDGGRTAAVLQAAPNVTEL